MERDLGEIFECNGKKYGVQMSDAGCEGCSFDKDECNDLYEIRGACCMRTDDIDVVFVKRIEMQVGEQFTYKGHVYTAAEPFDHSCRGCVFNVGRLSWCAETVKVRGRCSFRSDGKRIIYVE